MDIMISAMGTAQETRPNKAKERPNPYAPKPEGWAPAGGPLKFRITKRKLASRTSRFLAMVLDGVFAIVPYVVGLIVLLLAFAFGADFLTGLNAAYITAGVLSFAYTFVQIESLTRHAATIGKRMMGIYIADFESGAQATWVQAFLVRTVLWGLLMSIPIVDIVLLIIDIIFFFRADRRCLHDLVAKTVVYERDKTKAKPATGKKPKSTSK
jgi:uncharacterized RDD family membrane protein YckC